MGIAFWPGVPYRAEPNTEFDVASSENFGDLTDSLTLDVKEFVERQSIGRRRDTNQGAIDFELLGNFAKRMQCRDASGEGIVIGIEIDCQREGADANVGRT